MRLALFQPDIAGNVGAMLRLAACVAVPVDIILPCGFAASDRQLKRAAMDYGAVADVTRHADYAAFRAARIGPAARLVALTTQGTTTLADARFDPGDILITGSEGAGLPAFVHDEAALRVRIPMAPGCRSLNVALAAAMVLGEALRQTKGFPEC